jgi:hypothetical protein
VSQPQAVASLIAKAATSVVAAAATK